MSTEISKFDSISADIKKLVGPANRLKVSDKATMDIAQNTLQQIKAIANKLEEKRVELVKPSQEYVKTIQTLYHDINKPLEACTKILKDQLSKYAEILRQERIANEKRIRDEQKKVQDELDRQKALEAKEKEELEKLFGASDETELEVAHSEIESAAIENQQKVSELQTQSALKANEENKVKGEKLVWEFEIEKQMLVPERFKIVDDKIIRAAIAAGMREIPGVRIFQKTIIQVR